MWGQVLISALKGLSWRLGTAGVRSLLTMLTGSSCLLAVPYLLFAPLPYGAAASFASKPIRFLGGSGGISMLLVFFCFAIYLKPRLCQLSAIFGVSRT
jgi:hypothetical protein